MRLTPRVRWKLEQGFTSNKLTNLTNEKGTAQFGPLFYLPDEV